MRRFSLMLYGLAFSCFAAATDDPLHASWNEFILGLEKAQHSLTDPASFPPPSEDRNLAEGYRYLLGHLSRMIEREMRQDPRFPEFFRSVDMLRKWTAENPDAMYLSAPIDATGYYKVSGRAADHREWHSSQRLQSGPKAPRMVTFQTITAVPGNTGALAEMADCTNQTLDYLNSFNLQIDDTGHFEILIGPNKPSDYEGNFLDSAVQLSCPGTGETKTRTASFLSVREIFSDWEHERSLDMEIVRLDAIGASRPPIDSEFMREKLANLSKQLPNQIRFWQLLQEYPLEIRGDTNNDGLRNMPVNGINPPRPPFTAGGVAGAGQIYSGGLFDLQGDEALVIKVTAPVEPHYVGMQLANLWFEGPDQQNYVSSLSGHQLPVASDGSRYYIIAHRDPGVLGWVDTTGLKSGSISIRFILRNELPEELRPTTSAQKLKLDELHTVIPADTPRISPEQRREEISIRQSHIKRRWRGH